MDTAKIRSEVLQIFIQNVSSFALTFDYTEWVE
jgi:hypothetical protein